jgi:predicted  nucleic acid-binding Zn-ribbon protein
MGNKFREVLSEASNKKREGKMLRKLHMLDDTIEDFMDELEDGIISVEDNPVFVKKAHQLLADTSKEYSEFIIALRAIVNAVDRKEKILPAFEKKESRVRDVLDGAGNNSMEDEPEEQEAQPEKDNSGNDEYELKVSRKDDKKKSGVKEALEMDENIDKKLWSLGRDVNWALPKEVGLRPKDSDFKIAAKKLGITIRQARKAWNEYTWS